ncbi:oocyte zinc finger protein XlCOF6-like isoform X2 [Esox lucius]|nr:oocyte zinc finger protein XlCOF6-like isoform X2 [Esox lucius]XP_034150244.1 oocyte zinc finger protein XlCOF6-like isoform X2 [Esox lucius]
MNPLSPEKEALMDEIEKSLWDLTEDHLSHLCERSGIDGSEVKGMNRRLLRRKIMEEMWDHAESLKSDEHGMSWLLQLKEDIGQLQENGSSATKSPRMTEEDDDDNKDVDCEEQKNEKAEAGFPGNAVKLAQVSPSQCGGDNEYDDAVADCNMENREWLPSSELEPKTSDDDSDHEEISDDEDSDWMPSDAEWEAASSPVRNTTEQGESDDTSSLSPSALLETPGCASPRTALLLGLKRVSVHLVDCRKMLGQSEQIVPKTTHSDNSSCILSNAEQHNITVSENKSGSHICDHCGKDFVSTTNLKTHLLYLSGERSHVCSLCGKRFVQTSCLKRHMRTHTGEKLYVCPCCGKACSDSGNLKRHIRKTHSGEKVVVKRKAYQRSVPNVKEGLESNSGDSLHICDHCGKSFITARNLKQHQQYLQRRQENVTAGKSHVCSECGKGFDQAGSLKRHLRIHTGEKPYVCPQCGKAFNDSGNLKKHMRFHTGKPRTAKHYPCSECGKQLNGKQSLKHHQKIFHTEHPYRCGHCKMSFVSATRLETHTKTRHPATDPLLNPHVCSECGRGFPVAANLKRHLRIHTGEKPYVCSQCGNSYSDGGNFQKHMRSHTGEKPYHCSLCSMKFCQTSALKWHHRKNHKGETLGPIRKHQEPLQCPHCEDKLSTKAFLKDHLQKTHNGVHSRFQCPQCDKTFSNKTNLRVHQRQHTGERPFLCPQCGKSFSLSGSLTLHLRIHAGEKPYGCTFCDKRFISKSQCTSHLRIHTGEKPYRCADCGRCFTDGNVLKNHLRTHTGERPFHCRLCSKAFAQLSSLRKHQDTHRPTLPASFPCPYPQQSPW